MEIKEVVLKSEKEAVICFLKSFDLSFEENTDFTFYAEDNSQIVGTVSVSGSLIKQLAVSESVQGENLASRLVSEAINKLAFSGIYHYKVFTKPVYKNVFTNLSMKLLIETDKFVALEGGDGSISAAISRLSTKINFEMGGIEPDTAAIVINGNPFTEGHLALSEYAGERHKRLIVFVLEEDSSYFTFKERYSLAYLALRPYSNIIVLPSTEYIVSKSTFPSYFLHGVTETTEEYAKYDALIFQKYFMPALGIVKRYFGTETTDYMNVYNSTMKDVLGDKVEFVDRFTLDGEVVSAKKVRNLIEHGDIEKALRLVPQSTRAVLNSIITSKNV